MRQREQSPLGDSCCSGGVQHEGRPDTTLEVTLVFEQVMALLTICNKKQTMFLMKQSPVMPVG